ncbi:hypothetical protein GALL_176560 [mine drainage metagenome]|uniref:Uncharacterized protein n=1 Tax=mine drainage metagenome TaxID=410659 RepID=A0A1J5RW69_9ZZZZ
MPTQSGYVHLDGAELVLKPADPSLGLTHCLDCPYEPEGVMPAHFAAFVQRVLPDPSVRARVQEYIG